MILIHADESCLGNQNSTPSRGGAAAFVEILTNDQIDRRDLRLSSPDTTNNRMALIGATEVIALLANQNPAEPIIYFSDSQYLVKGMNEWIHSWKAKGWRRRGGDIENLQLWKTLDRTAGNHDVTFRWVRGHDGHAKNEYADHIAVQAAENQTASAGLESSGWSEWLEDQQQRGHFGDYDADAHFHEVTATPTRR